MSVFDMFDLGTQVGSSHGGGEIVHWSVGLVDDPAEFGPYYDAFNEAKEWADETGGKLIVQFEEPDTLTIYGLFRDTDQG